jgi:hypothetical protein
MSEKRPLNEPLLPTPEHAEVALPTAEQAEPLRPGEKVRNLEQARTTVEQSLPRNQANPLDQLAAAETAPKPVPASQISRELRQASLNHELHQIRRRLPAPQRQLSRIIHQPAVRAASDAAGRSVSRPSGLLGGGVVAFIGTSGYLYLARHTGFRYNYLVFLILLAGGFGLGLIIEALVYLATRRRQSD